LQVLQRGRQLVLQFVVADHPLVLATEDGGRQVVLLGEGQRGGGPLRADRDQLAAHLADLQTRCCQVRNSRLQLGHHSPPVDTQHDRPAAEQGDQAYRVAGVSEQGGVRSVVANRGAERDTGLRDAVEFTADQVANLPRYAEPVGERSELLVQVWHRISW
jgi:hypothetical protein